MKYLIIWGIAAALVLSTCAGEEKAYNEQAYTVEKYTLEKLQRFQDGLDPIGENFWDIFKRYESQYSLSDDENKLLGDWASFKEWGTFPRLSFFPNRLFIADINMYNFVLRKNSTAAINQIMGEWYISDDRVKVTIYGYIVWEKEKKVYEYALCAPYEVDLINIQDVDPIGYTLKAFNYISVPEEIKKIAKKTRSTYPKLKKDQSARHLSSIDIFTDSGGPEHDYGLFNFFPVMAKRKLSGRQIARSPELVMEVFKNFEFNEVYWSYEKLSEKFPEEFPELW
jgi:hypothetical protein